MIKIKPGQICKTESNLLCEVLMKNQFNKDNLFVCAFINKNGSYGDRFISFGNGKHSKGNSYYNLVEIVKQNKSKTSI